MTLKSSFYVQLGVPESKIEPCRVEVQGDVESENWQTDLMRGVVELISMIDQMYGKQIVDEALKERK
jgi:hypothetical protein